MKFIAILPAVAAFVVVPETAMAAGDLPMRMTAKQVVSYYQSLRPLLTVDGVACPINQQPMSGVRSGGASPEGGSEKTILTFRNGQTISVTRLWDRSGGKQSLSVKVDC